MSMPFGKYKGREFYEIPTDYLEWVIGVARPGSLLEALKRELYKRNAPPPPPPPPPGKYRFSDPAVYDAALDIITRGYRQAAKANHPDHGGEVSKMQAVNLAADALRALLGNRTTTPKNDTPF